MRRIAATIAALALVAAAGACGGGGSGSGAGDTKAPLVVAFSSFSGESALSWMVKSNDMRLYAPLFDQLAVTDPKTREVRPQLATSWKSSADGKTWTLHLRENVPFHDAEYGNVKSEDVAYQIERMNGKEAAGSDVPYFRGATVKTPDPLTVVVTMPKPTWEFPYHLTADAGYLNVQPKAYIEKVGDAKAATEPIGTGPYRQTSYSPGVEHAFEAVPDHWRVHPDFPKMTMKVISEPAARLNGLRASEIDIALVSGDTLKQAQTAGLKIKTVDDASQYFLALPGMAQPGSPSYDPGLPWVGDDGDPASAERALKVRRALNLAVNRKAIFDGLWNGAANRETFNYNYFPWQPGYRDSWTLPEYDPEQAKKLLAEAGYPGGFTIKVASTAMAAAPDGPDVTAAIVQDFERIGVKVDSTDMAYASLSPKFLDRSLDRAWTYGSVTRPEPSMIWSIIGYSKGAGAILVERSQFDTQLEAVRAELDGDKRAELTSRLGQSLYDYLPAVMIGTKPVTWALSDRVGGWPTLPMPEPTNLEQVSAAK
jgi:peptide/nickel transport system substrate-binding protein